MVLQLKLRKVGNSVGLVLPKEALAHLKLEEGDSVCVTEGPDGAWLILSPDVAVVDKTGAGDAFAGALAVGLLWGRPIEEAARLAVAASAAAVGGYGAQPSYPDGPTLDRLLAGVRAQRLEDSS